MRSTSSARAVALPIGCAGPIFAVTAACFVAGLGALVAWQATGEPAWIREFFQVPGALLMLWLAAVELWLSLASRNQFAPGELLRTGWTWISLSAAADLAGALCVQILSVDSRLNVLTRIPGWSAGAAQNFSIAGHLLGGPLRFGLLAAGLWAARQAYRRARFLGRFRKVDIAIVALFGVYVVRNIVDVVVAVRAGKVVTWVEVANWPTDPLLMTLLAIALRLYRSVQQMGGGWIGRCWWSFSLGVFFTALGDVGGWAEAYSYLSYPWSAVVWFLWIPAAACLALAPAHQIEAIRRAREGRLQ